MPWTQDQISKFSTLEQLVYEQNLIAMNCCDKDGGTGISAFGIVDTKADLNTKDSTTHRVYYVIENKSFYQHEAENPDEKSGAVAGLSGYWIPQFYRTNATGLTIGNNSINSNDGFFNQSIFKVISQPGSNVPLVAFGTDAEKVSGMLLVNIDYNNGSYMPEVWWRGNVLPGDWACEAGVTNRVLITGTHTKQLGFGIASMTLNGDHTKYWDGYTPPMREDAITLWGSRSSLINQRTDHSAIDDLCEYYFTGHGHGYFKSALKLGSKVFTGDVVIAHQAATFISKATVPVLYTLPDPLAIDVWNKREFENMEIVILNLGTNIISFDKNIRLDAGTVTKRLNHQSPDNTIKIKCVAGEWIKIA